MIADKSVKVFETAMVDSEKSLEPGEFYTDKKSFLYVGTNEGIISIISLQPQGKRRMQVRDFLAGNASLFS